MPAARTARRVGGATTMGATAPRRTGRPGTLRRWGSPLVDHQLVLVKVHEPVDVVDVVVEQVVGRVDGDDGSQRGRTERPDLDGVEASPGDAPHAHVSARPRLCAEPGDHLQRVGLLLLGVLPLREPPLALTRSPDVHPGPHEAPGHQVAVQAVVPLQEAVVLAIGQVLEDGGEPLAGRCAVREVQSGGEADAVPHGDPGLFGSHPVAHVLPSLRTAGVS
jgi:hypothetical protein